VDEKLLVPVVLVPLLTFLLASIPYGYFAAGLVATIACLMVGITGKMGIKEIAFITGLNLLILLLYLYLFKLAGVNITIAADNLVNFAVGGLVGGFLAWLVKK